MTLSDLPTWIVAIGISLFALSIIIIAVNIRD